VHVMWTSYGLEVLYEATEGCRWPFYVRPRAQCCIKLCNQQLQTGGVAVAADAGANWTEIHNLSTGLDDNTRLSEECDKCRAVLESE
jgi:hypothetical protein